MLWGVVGGGGGVGVGCVFPGGAEKKSVLWLEEKAGRDERGPTTFLKDPKNRPRSRGASSSRGGGGVGGGKTSPDCRLSREKVAPVRSRTGSRNNSWQQNSQCFIITNDKSIETIVVFKIQHFCFSAVHCVCVWCTIRRYALATFSQTELTLAIS